MATVVLVQLAIAVLGSCVLIIAAAPALTRPGRALIPSPGEPGAPSMPATLRVAIGRMSRRWHELVAAATVAGRSCRVYGARGGAAIRRGSEWIVAAVGTRVRTARTLAYQARHAREPRITAAENMGGARPDRMIDLRDRSCVGDPSHRPRHRA